MLGSVAKEISSFDRFDRKEVEKRERGTELPARIIALASKKESSYGACIRSGEQLQLEKSFLPFSSAPSCLMSFSLSLSNFQGIFCRLSPVGLLQSR